MFFLNGDFRFFWQGSIKDFASLPFAWDSSLNTGLGHSQLSSLWITSYFNFTALFTKLGLSWNIIQLIFWILPAILISFLSSFFLFNYLFKNKRYALLSGLIYLLNTYFLMILAGGQLGVSLAYSLVPLVFLRFIKFFEKSDLRNSILAGLALSLQLLFDPRIVYITIFAIFVYLLFNFKKLISIKNKLSLLIPFGIAILLNFFWIFPLILSKSSPLPTGFNSSSGFKFFSFADFSNALSLLHPNWPENIFGKVYFLDPKFLILPILAFSSLLFTKNKNILYFAFLSLLGVFLAKGANPPFGGVNLFLFEHFPGMSMFRDPTKFYILIALSYSVLIPYCLSKIQVKYKIFLYAFLLFAFYYLILIFPITNQIKFKQVPNDYARLANFLSNQETFSRTLWIPEWQRFGYFSNNHPAIGREELYKGSARQQILKLNENLLKDLSVKYIVIPYDSQSEIFLKDRKYNEKEYIDAINRLKKISWLKEVQGFGNIKVFALSNSRDHFWSPSQNLKVQYKLISPTEYKVQVQNAHKGDLLVFSEGFDKNWSVQGSNFKVQTSEFERVNSFVLPKDGTYDLTVYYEPQKYVEAGLWISGLTLVSSVLFLVFGKSLKKW